MLPPLLTLAEAARQLRLSPRKLYGLVAERRVPHVRIDGRLLFQEHRLAAWLDGLAEGEDSRPAPPVLAGSHDPLLEWAVRESGSGLALLTEGSGDGLRRLVAGEAMAAGLHLPGPEPDGGNIAAALRLGLADLVLIGWAERQQGLVLPPGNPAAVTGLADLKAKGLRLARRQSGAGAQLLLHQLLAGAGLAPADLAWTSAIHATESELAAAVQDGKADAGLAVMAVAWRYRLAFLPLAVERFDLAMRRVDYFEPPLQRLLAFARKPALADRAAELGGYDLAPLGSVRRNGLRPGSASNKPQRAEAASPPR